MAKLNREFLGNEVLFVGYSSRNQAYSKSIYKAFIDNGIKVYPLNSRQDGKYDVKVYKDLSELPQIPKCAYILLNKAKTMEAVKQLKDKGINKILFHNAKTVGQDTLEECSKMGIETAVACPMMLLGSGMHRLHGFLAGVKR
jgi:acyl-CoA synthetase (NDP forming)